MRAVLILNKQNPPVSLVTAKEMSSSDIGAATDVTGIELINMGDCSAVPGGPQISNRPPA